MKCVLVLDFITCIDLITTGVLRKTLTPAISEVYRELKNFTSSWLAQSSYSNVDLGRLFYGLGLSKVKSEIKLEREVKLERMI